MFKKIEIHKWRQFEQIDINFHRKLTVLTGANGAGKTTILNLLSRHFGWSTNFISTPKKDSKLVTVTKAGDRQDFLQVNQ